MAKTGLYLGDTPIGRIITVSQSTGGTDTSDATATASDILVGKTAYGSGGKITGTIQTKSQATYTPGTANQTITSGVYLTGTQTIKGDSNLVASNIKSGTSIFGVTGTYEGNNSGSGVDVSGVTAIASDVLSPKVFVDSTGAEQTGTIATKTSSDLTASGATVTVPAGYYASQATKSVATATQATPSISVSSSGLITASATQSAGYVSSGSKSATKQLSTKSATTYTPSTSNQTISSGYYLTGTQTIKGDSNLVASNIKSGVSIFGVSGSYSGESNASVGGELTAYSKYIIRVNYAQNYNYVFVAAIDDLGEYSNNRHLLVHFIYNVSTGNFEDDIWYTAADDINGIMFTSLFNVSNHISVSNYGANSLEFEIDSVNISNYLFSDAYVYRCYN